MEKAALQKIKPQQQDLTLFKKNGTNPTEASNLIVLVKILHHNNYDKGIAASYANLSRLQAVEHANSNAL